MLTLTDVDKQIKSQFPNEYRKFAEGKQRAGPLPGHSSRRHLGIFDWIRFTTGITEPAVLSAFMYMLPSCELPALELPSITILLPVTYFIAGI